MINIPVVWRRNIELWRAVMIFGCKSRVIVRWISLHQTSWKALRRVFIKGSRNLWGGFAVLSYSGCSITKFATYSYGVLSTIDSRSSNQVFSSRKVFGCNVYHYPEKQLSGTQVADAAVEVSIIKLFGRIHIATS